MMMQPGMHGQGPPQPMARQLMPPPPWARGYGVGGSPPAQPQAQSVAQPAPPPPSYGTGTASVIDANSDALLARAAAHRQDAANAEAERLRKKAEGIGTAQAIGTAVGGVAGAAASMVPVLKPFAPLLMTGGATLGGQFGRKLAGGDVGFSTAMPGAARAVQTLPRVSRDYRTAQRQAAVQNYIEALPPSQFGAYVNMPPSVAGQFNQGNFGMFEDVWVPMFNERTGSGQTGDFNVAPPAGPTTYGAA